jgi:hypothetical protein
MEPRMEAWTMRIWLLTKAMLLKLDRIYEPGQTVRQILTFYDRVSDKDQ